MPLTPDDYLPLSRLAYKLSLTGNVCEDVPTFFGHYNCPDAAQHSAQVAAEAGRIAALFGEDVALAEIAGWLHDISAIFPAAIRVEVAKHWNIPVLVEEELFPMIVHQKLSQVLAREVFAVSNVLVLHAVGCHTTLKMHATRLDKVLFVADKIAWDQPGIPPYHDDMLAALEYSLNHAALVYLHYLWERRHMLRVLHPWAQEAYVELSQI